MKTDAKTKKSMNAKAKKKKRVKLKKTTRAMIYMGRMMRNVPKFARDAHARNKREGRRNGMSNHWLMGIEPKKKLAFELELEALDALESAGKSNGDLSAGSASRENLQSENDQVAVSEILNSPSTAAPTSPSPNRRAAMRRQPTQLALGFD